MRLRLAAVALAVVLAALVNGALDVRTALRRTEARFADARRSLAAGDAAAARHALAAAAAAAGTARARASAGVLALLGRAPLLGSPVDAAGAAAGAALDAVQAGRVLAGAVERSPFHGDVAFDGENLSPFRGAAAETRAALAQARGLVGRAQRRLMPSTGATLPPVRRRARRAVDAIRSMDAQLARAESAVALSLDLLREDGATRLLLVAQDTLELRATGGFIGSFGVLRLGRTIELERYDSYESLPPAVPVLEPPEPMGGWLPSQWGLSNVNWWPDFPTTAEKAREMFRRQGGGEVDGVLAVTERLLARLVGIFGPVQLPGYSEPVVEEGFEQRVVYEVELKQPADVPRKKFLIELAHEVLRRLFSLDGGQVGSAVRAVEDAVAQGDLQVWFADPGRQRVVEGTSWAGAIPRVERDFLMLVETNRSASKANEHLVRDVTYRVRRQGTGGLVGELRAVYRNEGEETHVNPWYYGHLRIYVPRGATLLSADVPAREAGGADDGPYDVIEVPDVFVEPLSSFGFRIEYALPERVRAGDYRLTWVRQAGTTADELVAVVGGRAVEVPRQGRRLEVRRDLTGSAVADFVRSRWLYRRLRGG